MIFRPCQNRSARGQKSLHLFAVKSPRMRGGCEVQLRYRRCLRWGMLRGLEEHGFAARNGKQSLVVRCLFVTKPLLVDPSISQFQFRSINCTSSMSNVAFTTSISQCLFRNFTFTILLLEKCAVSQKSHYLTGARHRQHYFSKGQEA